MQETADPDLTAATLLKEHGKDANTVARSKLQEAMQLDDVKLAGFWMAVLYALGHPAAQAH